jgi:2-dehydro-3-deoxyphosphogluconate aldolase / (4S)-4-hydroxy-2-oxoglutarate aldolase
MARVDELRRVDDLRRGRVANEIRDHRLIAVLRRLESRQRLIGVVDELADAGVHLFEVTFDAPSAADDLTAVRARLARRDDGPFQIGAGTVLHPEQLEAARAAGADFGVSPILDRTLVTRALTDGLPFIPGALTPSEIVAAWDAGATFVKLFPASAVGPALVRELRGPLPEVELIPTGGIDADNAAAFVAAGATAIGVGSALVQADPTARRALIEAVGR